MSDEIKVPPTRVYTTIDGRAVIEQPQGSVILFNAEQILTVIRELNACYDYCAAWRDQGKATP